MELRFIRNTNGFDRNHVLDVRLACGIDWDRSEKGDAKMNELDIFVNGMIAYGLVIAGYALCLEAFGFNNSKPSETRATMTLAPASTQERHTSSLKKAA
jgi:hypothetical protein